MFLFPAVDLARSVVVSRIALSLVRYTFSTVRDLNLAKKLIKCFRPLTFQQRVMRYFI